MATDLNFKGAHAPLLGHADLNFGLTPTQAPVAATGVVRVEFKAPTARLSAKFDAVVLRLLAKHTQASWQPAQPQAIEDISAAIGHKSGWSITQRQWQSGGDAWQGGQPIRQQNTLQLERLVPQRSERQAVWQSGVPINSEALDQFDFLQDHRLAQQLPWQRAAFIGTQARDGFVWLTPWPKTALLAWQITQALLQDQQFEFTHGVNHRKTARVPWQLGRQLLRGMSQISVVPPSAEAFYRTPPIALNFLCRLPVNLRTSWHAPWWLRFGLICGGGGDQGSETPPGNHLFSIPILKVYLMQHSLSFVRLPERVEIPIKSLTMGIDMDSWCWSLSATLPGSVLPLVEPSATGPIEVEASINGNTWVFWVEDIDVRREFGTTTISIRGRSRAAWLTEPYAPKRSFTPTAPITARQLAENELSRASLGADAGLDSNTGFTLDWNLVDWLIPAGAVSFDNQSPIAVINRIAEIAGGFVQAHPALKKLVANSRVPRTASGDLLPPWMWNTQDTTNVLAATLPLQALRTLNIRSQDKPAHNAVYVSGERAGVTAFVKRSGTAGESQAPMVIDALVTHADAARARGTTVLAQTGRQAVVSIEMPLWPTLGVLPVGKLIEVASSSESWRAQVQGVGISAQWQDTLTVRQTLELVRHFEP
jgi:hypothetical protein